MTLPPPSPPFQVKDFFKTAFHNFLAYMVNLINEDLNLDIVFAQDTNAAVLNLFFQLMDLLPKPKLDDLKAYNNTWPPQQAHASIPLFPFFRRVATAMDKLVEKSVEEMQNTKNPVTNCPTDATKGSTCKQCFAKASLLSYGFHACMQIFQRGLLLLKCTYMPLCSPFSEAFCWYV